MGKTQRVVGIGLIVLALMLAAYAWTLGKEMTQRTPGQSVVVATEHIAAGTVLTPEKLQLMVFPTRPAGSFGELAGALFGFVIPYLIIWIGFTMLLFIMPNTRVHFYSALVGGILSGTMFQLLQYFYIQYFHF